MVSSPVHRLFNGLGVRLASSWTVAVERPLWKASAQIFFSQTRTAEQGNSVRGNKQQYTACKKSVEIAEWCRLSWVHTTKFARLFRWKPSWKLLPGSLLCSVVLSLIEFISYGSRASCWTHLAALVTQYWTGASSTANSVAMEIMCACTCKGLPGGQKRDIHLRCGAETLSWVSYICHTSCICYAYTPASRISSLTALSNYADCLNTTSFVSRLPRKGLFAPVQTHNFL